MSLTMPYFAPVAPIQILEELDPEAHLLLAHDIVKPDNAWRYRKFFSRPNQNQTVILDNSICELGEAVSVDMIIDAHDIVRPSCTVLPDVYLKTHETIQSCKRAIDSWPDRLRPFMIVPQGTTIEDFAQCCEAFAKYPKTTISTWGIPRNVVEYHGSRTHAIEVAKFFNPYRNVHMLGFSDDMLDDLMCCAALDVNGIDSAVPIRIDRDFTPLMEVEPRPKDWFETAQYTPLMRVNYQKVRSLINKNGVL